jgi:hypothetical protein
MRLSGIEQDTLSRRGFSRVDVGNNTNITVTFQRILASH